MSWVALDDRIYDHPKIIELDDLEAFGFWALCLAWVGGHLTDGHISEKSAGRIAGDRRRSRRLAAKLVAVRLWDVTEDGWLFHDYHDLQRSADEVKELTEKRKQAGRKGGLRSGQVRGGGTKREALASPPDEASASGLVEANGNHIHSTSPNLCVTTSSSLSLVEAPAGRERDQDERVAAAVEILAAEDLESARSARRIGNPPSYLAQCRASRLTDDGPGLAALAAERPDLDPRELISEHLTRRFLA